MGFAIIFNNIKFDNKKVATRIGSLQDVNRLRKVLYMFNFRVKVVHDPSLEDIRQSMTQLLNENLETAHGLVVILMTHGLTYDIALAKDKMYNIKEEIINSEAFQKHSNLKKIVITQACKVSTSEIPYTDNAAYARNIEISNLFRFDSTFEGNKSYRLRDGSPFIQLLCKHLEISGHTLDLQEIADNVLKQFEFEYPSFGVDQCPTKIITSDFGKFVFCKTISYNDVQEKDYAVE